MGENAFVNTNRYPKNNVQTNEEIVNYKRPRSITHNPSAHNAIQPLSENPTRNRSKLRVGKKNDTVDPSSSSTTKNQSESKWRQLSQSFVQCCRRKKTKIVKSKTSFVEYVKSKAKKRPTKKTPSEQHAAATKQPANTTKQPADGTEQPAAVRGQHAVATMEHPHEEDKEEKTTKRSKKAKKKNRKRENKKSDPAVVSFPSPTTLEPDQHKKLSVNQILEAAGQDFTKSCCYLCAKNALAIAAAISGQNDKAHMSVQTSVHFGDKETQDKSSSPMMYVRTVQSSVKVRTRDIGTLHPEKKKKTKKTKKLKPKLNFKRFSIIPKMKFPGHPKVRTVACETMRHNNVPQCMTRREGHCVTENQ